MRSFEERGFPERKDEEWRHTNLSPLLQTPFTPALVDGERRVDEADIEKLALPGLHPWRLVFMNGMFRPDLSGHTPSAGVLLEDLKSATLRGETLVEQYLTQTANETTDAFFLLNTAFLRNGAFVRLAEGVQCEHLIYLLHIVSAEADLLALHPRNLIVLSAGARAFIFEHYVSVGNTVHFTNAATDIILGKGAVLEHLRLQDESSQAFHLSNNRYSLGSEARLVNHNINLGARFARNSLDVALEEEQSMCILNGVYVGRGEQEIDNRTFIDHAKPMCESRELYKGILGDRAHGIFKGKILVRPEAQKTDAQQTNHCLLLSDEAVVNTMPQLEIYADDVKCSHGATVGELDAEALFYLQSRGIGLIAAKRMLTLAFMNEVLSGISIEAARSLLEARVQCVLPVCES